MDSDPLIGYISSNLIRWSVLIGLFYIILYDSKYRSVSYGLSQISFILFITYLFPNRLIVNIMTNINLYLKDNYSLNYTLQQYLILFIGIVISLLFILFEAFSLKYFSKSLEIYIYKLIKV